MGEGLRFPAASKAVCLLGVIEQKRPPKGGLVFEPMTPRGIEPRFGA